jgi:acyl-coenzyme A synthetase/AMP-(fatty) acid ligase
MTWFPLNRSRSRNEDKLVAELRSLLNERMSSYKIPGNFVFLDSLPRTTADKIDRSLLMKKSKSA